MFLSAVLEPGGQAVSLSSTSCWTWPREKALSTSTTVWRLSAQGGSTWYRLRWLHYPSSILIHVLDCTQWNPRRRTQLWTRCRLRWPHLQPRHRHFISLPRHCNNCIWIPYLIIWNIILWRHLVAESRTALCLHLNETPSGAPHDWIMKLIINPMHIYTDKKYVHGYIEVTK